MAALQRCHAGAGFQCSPRLHMVDSSLSAVIPWLEQSSFVMTAQGFDDPFGISPFGITPGFSSRDWDLGQRDVLGGSCKYTVGSYTISRQSFSCRYLGLSLGFCEQRVWVQWIIWIISSLQSLSSESNSDHLWSTTTRRCFHCQQNWVVNNTWKMSVLYKHHIWGHL